MIGYILCGDVAAIAAARQCNYGLFERGWRIMDFDIENPMVPLNKSQLEVLG